MHLIVKRQAQLVINGDYCGGKVIFLRIFIVIELIAGLDDATNVLDGALLALVVRMLATILASLGTKMQCFYNCTAFGNMCNMMMMG